MRQGSKQCQYERDPARMHLARRQSHSEGGPHPDAVAAHNGSKTHKGARLDAAGVSVSPL